MEVLSAERFGAVEARFEDDAFDAEDLYLFLETLNYPWPMGQLSVLSNGLRDAEVASPPILSSWLTFKCEFA